MLLARRHGSGNHFAVTVAQASHALVSTQVFVPEARWTLAGGSERAPPRRQPEEQTSPSGATCEFSSCAPLGLATLWWAAPGVPLPLHPRLISPVPPGQLACATLANETLFRLSLLSLRLQPLLDIRRKAAAQFPATREILFRCCVLLQLQLHDAAIAPDLRKLWVQLQCLVVI